MSGTSQLFMSEQETDLDIADRNADWLKVHAEAALTSLDKALRKNPSDETALHILDNLQITCSEALLAVRVLQESVSRRQPLEAAE